MKLIRKLFSKFCCPVLVLLLLQSCYSTVFTSTHGTPTPEINEREDYFKDKMVIEWDTIVPAGVGTDYSILKNQRVRCESGKIHSIEFKNSFGGALLYLVTFGSKRKVSIKYVCMEP